MVMNRNSVKKPSHFKPLTFTQVRLYVLEIPSLDTVMAAISVHWENSPCQTFAFNHVL